MITFLHRIEIVSLKIIESMAEIGKKRNMGAVDHTSTISPEQRQARQAFGSHFCLLNLFHYCDYPFAPFPNYMLFHFNKPKDISTACTVIPFLISLSLLHSPLAL